MKIQGLAAPTAGRVQPERWERCTAPVALGGCRGCARCGGENTFVILSASEYRKFKGPFPPRLFHRPRPPPRATLLPLVHAPGCALFSAAPLGAAPEHEASRWPALVGRRQAAGRPGSAGQDGLLVTGSGPPRAARGRTARV